jgi:hypothetical protein
VCPQWERRYDRTLEDPTVALSAHFAPGAAGQAPRQRLGRFSGGRNQWKRFGVASFSADDSELVPVLVLGLGLGLAIVIVLDSRQQLDALANDRKPAIASGPRHKNEYEHDGDDEHESGLAEA